MLMERRGEAGHLFPEYEEKNEDKRQPNNCEAADSLIFNILRVQPLFAFRCRWQTFDPFRSPSFSTFSSLLSREECERHNVLLSRRYSEHRRSAD